MSPLLCQASWGSPYRQSSLSSLHTCHSEVAGVMTPPKSVYWWLIIHSQTDWQYRSRCHVLPASRQLQQLSPRSLPALGCWLSSVPGKVRTTHGSLQTLSSPSWCSPCSNMILQQNSATDHHSYHKLQHCAEYAVSCFHLQQGFLVGVEFDLLLPLCSYVPCGEQESLPLA